MANALRVTLFVASYGAFGAIEALQNAMKREAIRDLPKRELNIRKDVKKSTAIFNKKVETFKRSDATRVDAQQESHKKVEERVQAREMQRTVEKALNINIDTPKNEHETYDLVPTKFSSAKDLMRALMIEGIDKGTTVDFEKLTIYKQPLKEFENVDKTDAALYIVSDLK
jgi:hypothetical protein